LKNRSTLNTKRHLKKDLPRWKNAEHFEKCGKLGKVQHKEKVGTLEKLQRTSKNTAPLKKM